MQNIWKRKKVCTQRSLDETSDTDAEILNSKKRKNVQQKVRAEIKRSPHLMRINIRKVSAHAHIHTYTFFGRRNPSFLITRF